MKYLSEAPVRVGRSSFFERYGRWVRTLTYTLKTWTLLFVGLHLLGLSQFFLFPVVAKELLDSIWFLSSKTVWATSLRLSAMCAFISLALALMHVLIHFFFIDHGRPGPFFSRLELVRFSERTALHDCHRSLLVAGEVKAADKVLRHMRHRGFDDAYNAWLMTKDKPKP